MKEKDTCRVPVRGTYTVDRKTGEITEKRLDYSEIPAAALAEFFLARFGIDAEEVKKNG